MEKSFNWHESGREKLDLKLQVDGTMIQSVEMSCVGCIEFLNMSQKMKTKLNGNIADLLPPTGSDHSSIIWREMIHRIQEEWLSPVAQPEICHCRKVSTEKVDRAIVYGAHTINEVRKRTSANTGCGTCKNDVEELISYRLKV